MKNFSLAVILFSYFFSATAQNYQCLQSDARHFFTNSNGYVRGIRIDSAKTFADTTVYYPYHTLRGYYLLNPNLDSTGGSWLGKQVVQRNDGTFLFDNLWHDSVVIKTQAYPGDTWIFYKDTTSLYYEANITGVDTMTVLGRMDSIKTILITAHSAVGVVTTDPVDSFRIILSKNNGFVRVFDLFTFPYHAPDSGYMRGYDFYLDHVIGPYGTLPTIANSVFSLINFIDPTLAQLSPVHVGNVYEVSECNEYPEPECPGCPPTPPEYYLLDTIVNVDIVPGGVNYNYSGWTATYTTPSASPPCYFTAPNSGVATVDSTLLFDTTLMPEEFEQSFFWTYSPNDSSYCVVNTLYSIQENFEIDGTEYYAPFEYYSTPSLYKSPLGLLSSYNISCCGGTTGDVAIVNSQNLIYYNIGGVSCGTLHIPAESVAEINALNTTIALYPNPVQNELTIIANDRITSVAIINLVGQTVFSNIYNVDKAQIDVADLPAGMYLIKVNGADVRKFVKE